MLPRDHNPAPPSQAALSRREAGAALLLLGLGGLAACGPVRPPRVSLGGTSQPRLVPTAARVDVVPGRTLVMPVLVDGPISAVAEPRLRTADGRDLHATLVWIGVEADAGAWTSWLPAFERWVVASASDGSVPASLGAWHVVAALPEDTASGTLELNGRPLPINWLADPDTLRPASVRGEWEPWVVGGDTPQPDPQLLAPEWRSPLRLWHARLVATGLGRSVATPGIWQVRGDAVVLDRLAELVEARWRVGLARLWYADAESCRRLLGALARTVELHPGTHAPAWPTDADAIGSLLSDLLDPSLTGRGLAARAQAWVDALPQLAVWVDDDAAELLGPSGAPLVRLRAAGLGERPQLLWISGKDGYRVGEPETIEPGGVAEMLVPAPAGHPITGGRSFTVRSGLDSLTVAANERIAIRPPGMRCGPLRLDWTLTAWEASAPASGDTPGPGAAAVVLVYRDFSGLGESGWAAFIECAATETLASAAADGPPPPVPNEIGLTPSKRDVPGDVVSLWFGQRGRPAAVLRVSRTGAVREDLTTGGEQLYTVVDEGDRWSVSVPIPAAAIEPGNIVRLGIERRDGRGVRTAWPRRLMPWDREPSRIVIDLNTWSGLTGS